MTSAPTPGAPIATFEAATRRLVRHGSTTVLLQPTSATFRGGRTIAISGPSGSGKTTLCHLLLEWERPDDGSVTFHSPTDGWSFRSFAPQRLGLVTSLTCGDNIRLAAWAAAAPTGLTPDDLAEALDVAHLDTRLPRQVSLGEQQRVAVARALVGPPRLVVLDEPTCHQDEDHVTPVLDAIRRAAGAGACVVVATHDPDVISAADEVVALRPPG